MPEQRSSSDGDSSSSSSEDEEAAPQQGEQAPPDETVPEQPQSEEGANRDGDSDDNGALSPLPSSPRALRARARLLQRQREALIARMEEFWEQGYDV